jgi:general secretion pathway protein G
MKINQTDGPREGINQRRQNAFTLVELLLVLAILALMAGIVLPKLMGNRVTAEKRVTVTQIGAFKDALNMFEVDNGHYPKGKNGLNDLVVKPRDASADWHQYLEKIPLDPWGNPYVYECPGRHNPNGFDITSAGPDKQLGTEDDIGNWDAK